MQPSQRAKTIRNVAPYVIIALIVLVFVWFAAHNPIRAVGEISATIEGVTSHTESSQNNSEQRSAVIRLSDGTIAEARIVTPVVVQPGQRVKIKVYEELLSPSRQTYEVVGTPD